MTKVALTGTLFCFLGLTLPSVVRGQTTCLGVPCVTNANTCVNNRCSCDSGFVGNGRTLCTTNRCVCSSVADPHVSLYDPQNPDVTANLPCSYTMTSATGVGGTCSFVSINMETENRGSGNEAFFRIFAKSLTATLFVGGVPVPLSVSATTAGPANADGYLTVTNTACNLEMGYNDTYGAVYISLPTGISFLNLPTTVCGDCDGTANEAPGTTPEAHLSYMMRRLAAVQQEGPYKTQCTNLQTQTATASCTDANIIVAGQVCLPYISTSFGLCLLNAGEAGVTSYDTLLTSFVACVTQVCGGNVATACAALTAIDTSSATCALSAVPAPC